MSPAYAHLIRYLTLTLILTLTLTLTLTLLPSAKEKIISFEQRLQTTAQILSELESEIVAKALDKVEGALIDGVGADDILDARDERLAELDSRRDTLQVLQESPSVTRPTGSASPRPSPVLQSFSKPNHLSQTPTLNRY